MKKLILTALAVCLFVTLCFAADNGAVGNRLVEILENFLKDNTVAASVYTAIIGLLGIGIRVLLKKIPTTMQGLAGKIAWKIAAALFGSGVVLENHTDPEYVKKELVKKYPLLQIDIKKLAEESKE